MSNTFDNEEIVEQQGLITKIASGTKNVVTGTVCSLGSGIWWAGSGLISVGGNLLHLGNTNQKPQKKQQNDELTGQQLVDIQK